MQRPRLRIPQVARPAEMRDRVDLLLVLAVDASASISAEEARMQQRGYQRALPHPEVLTFFQRKGSDYDRWLAGMRRLQARVRG